MTEQRNTWLKPVLIGCGGLLALALASGIGFFYLIKGATSGPEAAVKSFLAAAGEGDYARAHGHFSKPLQEVQSLASFTAGVQQNPSLFDVADTTFNERSVDNSGARLAGTLHLRAGTDVPASFSLVRENEAWKLIAYQIGGD